MPTAIGTRPRFLVSKADICDLATRTPFSICNIMLIQFVVYRAMISQAEDHIHELENQMLFLGREVKHLSHLRHCDHLQSVQQRR